MNTVTYKSRYGTYEDAIFQSGRYSNGSIGIEIWSNTEGPITKVTINPGFRVPDDRIAIKNYSENEGMVDWLISEGLIHPDPIQTVMIGFVEVPIHKLTKKGKKTFNLEL